MRKELLLKLVIVILTLLFPVFSIDYSGIRTALNMEVNNRSVSIATLAGELDINRSTLTNFLQERRLASPTVYKAVQKYRPYLLDRLAHAPQFVLNTIFHAPSIVKTQQVSGCMPKQLTFKYIIDSKVAGVLEECEQILSKTTVAPGLIKFLNVVANTSFENQDRLKGLTSVILLNRMNSVDPAYNDDFEQLPLNLSVKCNACKVLWSPTWKCKATGVNATLKDVKEYYDSLSEYDKVLFLEYERSCSSKIVPYAGLRDCLLHDITTKTAVQALRTIDQTAPVFIAFTDKDTISFNHAFDKYLEAISKHSNLVCLTSGYLVSGKNPQISHVRRANNLDYMIRRTTESVIPYSTYFTDLNTLVRVLPEQDTLQEIFPRRFRLKASDHRNEMKYLLEDIIKERYILT